MEGTMLQTEWGWQIALYLFLGGLAAGTLLVSGVISLRAKDGALHKTVRFGAWAALGCLAAGLLCLISEVRMPLRALVLWQSFANFGSWMAIGAWLLVAGGVAGLLYALANTDALTKKAAWLAKLQKPLAAIVCVLGVCIAAYTGVLLSVLVAHPLWNTPLLPILFTVSAIDTGVALLSGYAVLREEPGEACSRMTRLLETTTVVLVGIEVVVLVAMLAMVGAGGEVGALSVATLLTGTLALPFWLLFVVCGLALPLVAALMAVREGKTQKTKLAATGVGAAAVTAGVVVESSAAGDAAKTETSVGKAADKPKTSRAALITVVGSAGCLVGGCALRFLILLAGLPVWA